MSTKIFKIAIFICLLFIACKGTTPEENILGTWSVDEFEFPDNLSQARADYMEKQIKGTIITFTADDSISMSKGTFSQKSAYTLKNDSLSISRGGAFKILELNSKTIVLQSTLSYQEGREKVQYAYIQRLNRVE